MALIKQETLDAIYSRLDIVDIVSDHVSLKRTGSELSGLCPFHEDKSPSFMVNPNKSVWVCHGCQQGGNAVKFLMDIKRQTFPEAIMELAARYDINVEFEESGEKAQAHAQRIHERARLLEVMELAAQFYQFTLSKDIGAEALEYLTETRRLTPEVIQQFGLGYAPPPGEWHSLHEWLMKKKDFPVEVLLRAGLVTQKDGKVRDRFLNRAIIPIYNLQGKVIAFGGRAMGPKNDYTPKYLNSPETLLFVKGEHLYGLNWAAPAITRADQAIVVEGYFDVIALHAAGVQNVVASMGTALSASQIQKLTRLSDSKRINFNFDADKAGLKAVASAIGNVEILAFRGDLELHVVAIPEGKDPDGYLQNHSADDYRLLVRDAPPWIDWQMQQLIGAKDVNAADGFAYATREIVTLLGKIVEAPLRSHYIRSAAILLAQALKDPKLAVQIEEDLRLQVKGERWLGQSRRWQRPEAHSIAEAAADQLLLLYLHVVDIREVVHHLYDHHQVSWPTAKHQFLWDQMLKAPENSELIQWLQEQSPEWDESIRFHEYLVLDEQTQLDLKHPIAAAEAAAAHLEQLVCQQRADHIMNAMIAAVDADNKEAALDLQAQYRQERSRIRQLESKRGLYTV